jgi:hypothetical protein
MQAAEDRPPFVCFEVRAMEDRNASIEAGHYVAKDVDFALVTPRGSKDRVERVASEWIATLQRESQNNRFPREWLNSIESGYKDWKNGREAAVDGTPIANWPVLSPSQVVLLQQVGVRSVEDLATANEELIAALSLGGRALVDKAKAWVESSQDLGKVSSDIAALRVHNETLEATNKSLKSDLEALKANITQLQNAKAGQ